MKIHELKCWPRFFDDVREGRKPFEYRLNDRDYKVGDVLRLRKFDPETNEYHCTHDELLVKVTYIVTEAPGLPDGYCIMAIGRGTL